MRSRRVDSFCDVPGYVSSRSCDHRTNRSSYDATEGDDSDGDNGTARIQPHFFTREKKEQRSRYRRSSRRRNRLSSDTCRRHRGSPGGSSQSSSGEENPRSVSSSDSSSRSERGSSASTRPRVRTAASTSGGVRDGVITELLAGQREPVAFVGACPLHHMPFPSVVESLQQSIAGSAAATAAVSAAHRPRATAAAATRTVSFDRAAAAASTSDKVDTLLLARELAQPSRRDPRKGLYVQEVWCSSVCGVEEEPWQQRLQRHFLRFLSDSAALRASARVLLLMRPDVWFQRAAPHSNTRGAATAPGGGAEKRAKRKNRGPSAAAENNAAVIAALSEAGMRAGTAPGDSDSSECEGDGEGADMQSPGGSPAAAATADGNPAPSRNVFSRRKQPQTRRRSPAEETEFVVRMLQWLQEALELQHQLCGEALSRPGKLTAAPGAAGERRTYDPKESAVPALVVGVFEQQLPSHSLFHKVFQSWLLLSPPRPSFFPTKGELAQLSTCQQQALAQWQRLVQHHPQQLRAAAAGALVAFANSPFSQEEEEELLAIVEGYEQQQRQDSERLQQRHKGREEQRPQHQPEQPAASLMAQQTERLFSSSTRRRQEARNQPGCPPPYDGERATWRRQQALQEEEDDGALVNCEVAFPGDAGVMLLPEEEELVRSWKRLVCRGHGRQNSSRLQAVRCERQNSRSVCSRGAAAGGSRAGVVMRTAAAEDPAAPAGHEERTVPQEGAPFAVPAADAAGARPFAAAMCVDPRVDNEGQGGTAAAAGLSAGGTAGDLKLRSAPREGAAVAATPSEAAPGAPAGGGVMWPAFPVAASTEGRGGLARRLPASPALLCAPPFVVSLPRQPQQHFPQLQLPSFQASRLVCGDESSAPLFDTLPPLLLRCACCRCAASRKMIGSSTSKVRHRKKTSSQGTHSTGEIERNDTSNSRDGPERSDAVSCCHCTESCRCKDEFCSNATSGPDGRFSSSGTKRGPTGDIGRERGSRSLAACRTCDFAESRRRHDKVRWGRTEDVDSRSSRGEGRSVRKANRSRKKTGRTLDGGEEKQGLVFSDCRCFCLHRRETLWRGMKAGEGRSFLICGPLGSGKSVLLRTLACALRSSSSNSWGRSSRHDTRRVTTGCLKKSSDLSNEAGSNSSFSDNGDSCSRENSSRTDERHGGCRGPRSGSDRCERDAALWSDRQSGGVVFAHVGQLLHAEVGASQQALMQLFSTAAAADAAVCLECIDVAFGSAGRGRQKELWIEDDGDGKGCRGSRDGMEKEEDGAEKRSGDGEEQGKETRGGRKILADDYEELPNSEEGREELLFEDDDDELPGHVDDPVAELQGELMQLFETLVDVFVKQGGVTLFCTVSTRPEFLPLQLLRCFSDTIRLSPMLR